MGTVESLPPVGKPLALVTGASSGIGAAFARELARRGHPLVLTARSRPALDRLAASLPVPARVLPADLTTADGLARVEEALTDPGAPVGLLVNNAGSAVHGGIGRQGADVLDHSILLNVLAPTRLTAAALRALPVGGGILNVSSTAAGRDDPAIGVYAAAKAYLESLSGAAREEARRRRITVTVLRPGRTRTAFHARAGEDTSGLPPWRWQDPEEVVVAGLDALERGEHEVTVVPSGRFTEDAS
jgi:uncharacterized protein